MKRILSLLLAVLMIVFMVGCNDASAIDVRYYIDGTLVHTETVEKGEEASFTPDAREGGYIFDGWYTDENFSGEKTAKITPEKDTDLYGRWLAEGDAATYTVTFVVDGNETKVQVREGETASIATPTGKTGFIFDGWYRDPSCEGEKFSLTTPITADITLYAGWRPVGAQQTYTVTFDLNGGSAEPAIPAQSVKAGQTATKPETTPTLDGYHFAGWYLGDVLYTFQEPVTQNIELKAAWEEVIPVTDGTFTATSSAAGHEATLAGDGQQTTYWQAQDAGAAELTVDLGGIQDVRTVRQIFAEEAVWEFEIKGSADNEHWATLTDCTKEEAAASYDLVVNGWFRYLKLCVAAGEKAASSREFSVGVSDLSEGTNIALGMKGGSDSWGGGYESEKAFDGKYDTFYCAYDGNMGHYLACEWTYPCYVSYIDFYMVDLGTFNYEVEGRVPEGTNNWFKLENAADHEGQVFRLKVEQVISGVILRVFHTPEGDSKWVSCTEMNVYGFQNVAASVAPETQEDHKVYDLGESYLSRVTSEAKAEYSADGEQWTEVTGEGVVEKHARYVRVPESAEVQIYATRFENDLARYIVPTASDSSGDAANYGPQICTMNPENVWAADGRFWCASYEGGEHTLELDFGNICVLQSWVYTFQDNVAEEIYKLKVEYSTDKVTWQTAFDNFDEAASGQTFTGEFGNVAARYVKITAEKVNGWTNCKQLHIYGVGAPVRPIEIR